MKEIERLESSWIKERPHYRFTFDGILNEDKWFKSKSRVMFLLKESADDFCNIRGKAPHDITKGKGNSFWYNIVRWWYLIDQLEHGFDNPTFMNITELKQKFRLFDMAAYANIKKNNENKSTSNHKNILDYAKRDRDFLKSQIDLINPKYILTNKTTFSSYKHIYANEKLELVENTDKRVYKHKERYIIRFYHPSARKKHSQMFLTLMGVLKRK